MSTIMRLDVPPEGDWRTANYRTAPMDAPPFCRPGPRNRPLHGPPAQLCSLCEQIPPEHGFSHCQACRVYMNHYRPIS